HLGVGLFHGSRQVYILDVYADLEELDIGSHIYRFRSINVIFRVSEPCARAVCGAVLNRPPSTTAKPRIMNGVVCDRKRIRLSPLADLCLRSRPRSRLHIAEHPCTSL